MPLGSWKLPVLAAGLLLGACGTQFAPPAPGAAQIAAAQRQIATADPLREYDRGVPEQQAMLRRVATRVVAAAQPMCQEVRGQSCRFSIAYDPSPEVNAYASGQSDVAVTAGLLRTVGSDAELAAVVAHELAHHVAGHIGRVQTRTTLGALAGAVVGSATGLGDLSGFGAGAARLVYSKAEEREADYLGAFITARAGYDLDEAAGIWTRLMGSGDRRRTAGILDTHPAGPERLAAWDAAAAEIAAGGAPRRATR